MSDRLHGTGVDRALLGELSGDEELALHAHLGRCTSCRSRYEQGLVLLRGVKGDAPTGRETERALRRLGAALAPERAPVPAPRPSLLTRLSDLLVWRPLVPAGAAAAVAVAVLLAAVVGLLPPRSPTVRIVALAGAAEVDGEPARAGQPLVAGRRITTGPEARLELAGTRGFVKVYPATDLEVTGAGTVVLRDGMVWCEIEPGSGGYVVKTPEAEVAVLGTEFGVERRGETTEARVASGKVAVQGGGGLVELGRGEKASVAAGAQPGPASSYDPAEDRRRWRGEAGPPRRGRTVDEALEDLLGGE